MQSTRMGAGVVFGAAILAGLAGQAAAQCQTSTGPDVIVGRIIGINVAGDQTQNYNVTGTLDALSLGTTSCNIGNAQLRWDAFPAATHPAIGGNLYKFKVVNGSGRFEQIGMSWLKHGFTALTQSQCCTCQNPQTGGTTLGIGCSDPYSGARNGGQGSLGPRWQVNATTGVFPSGSSANPNTPANSGTTYRRLEVLLTDLEASSAAVRYFGEAQYVSPDDASNGNQNNNASNIELTCTAGNATQGFNFAFANSGHTDAAQTHRQQAAIERWADAETGVTLTTVLPSSGGKLIVGSKATQLDATTWHYEYAVYNMNVDRNVGTFSLPVPAGVNVTNIGFHDVTYRNGDATSNTTSTTTNFSGTDWSNAISSGVITWQTESEGTNNRANAIRWGTTYNFRFDADVAPATGPVDATLGFWKAGSPASVTAVIQAPGTPPPPACPADFDNDGNFANGLNPDGGVDISDLLSFLGAFEAGNHAADLDNDGADPQLPDGGVDISDLLFFLAHFEGGC